MKETSASRLLVLSVLLLATMTASASTARMDNATLSLRGTVHNASDADQRRAEEIFAVADAAIFFPAIGEVRWVSQSGGAVAMSAGARSVATVREFENLIESDFPNYRTNAHGPYLIKVPAVVRRAGASSSPAAPSASPFTDSFENGLGNWSLGDDSSGAYKWTTSTCEARTGSSSADALRGGSTQLGCADTSPAQVSTWMIHNACDPIAGGSGAWLDAYIHLSTNGHDSLGFYYEVAPESWYGWYYYGTFSAWYHLTFNLKQWVHAGDLSKYSCPKLMIEFDSWDSPAGFGARVDDVTIGTTTPGAPTVSFTASPTSGSAPLTVNFTSTASGVDATGTYYWRFGDSASSTASTQNATFTYTTAGTYWAHLTVTNPMGRGVASAQIQVNSGPVVTVARFPSGMLQASGEGGATTSFALTNTGQTDTSLELSGSSDFFMLDPTSFKLPAGTSRTVRVTGVQKPAGSYDGYVTASGAGVPSGLKVPIRLVVATPPTQPVVATVAGSSRIELSATADTSPTGSIPVSNTGQGTLYGLLVSDAAWLVPQSGAVEIAPGQSKTLTFATDRSKRPDAGSAAGATAGTVTLTFFSGGGGGAKGAKALGTTPTSSVSVSIVDVVKPGVTPGTPPALTTGEIAYFFPGISSKSAATGDVALWNRGTSAITDLKMFFSSSAPGSQFYSTVLGSFAGNTALAFPGIVKNVFSASDSTGTMQLRGSRVSNVSVAGNQVNTSASRSSTSNPIPVIASYNAIATGSTICLTGVRKDSSSHTDVYVQETTGSGPASVTIDYLDASGSVVAGRAPDTIAAFGMLQLTDAVPVNAKSVRIRNTSSGTAAIGAYAMVVDNATGDAWSIIDLSAASGTGLLFPVPSPPAGSAGREFFFTNTSTSAVNVTITSWASSYGGKRRAATHSEKASAKPEASTRTLAISPLQTVSVTDLPSGFGRATYTPAGAIHAAGTFTAMSTNPATRAGIAAVPDYWALEAGFTRRFAGLEDSSAATIAARTPSTWRTNLLLCETSGQKATVRVTMYYQLTGSLVTTLTGATRDIDLDANATLKLDGIGNEIIGISRASFGDIHNAQLVVTVLSGSGSVVPFVEMIDNSSGDVTIRE